MTLRTEQVEISETVEQDIPICDGCGREVDLEHDHSTEWTPDDPDDDPIHTCHQCSIRSLASGSGRATPLWARLRRARHGPHHPNATLFGVLMAALTIGIVRSGLVTATESLIHLLAVSGFLAVVGLLMVLDESVGRPAEALLILPTGGLIGLFATTEPGAAWASLIAAVWCAVAYVTYAYSLDE